MYSYFILRLSFSFQESSYKIPKYKLIICSVSMCITSLTPAICAQYFAEYDNCRYKPLFICFVIAVIQDIFWAGFTLAWYIIKLVTLENSLNVARNALKKDKTDSTVFTIHEKDEANLKRQRSRSWDNNSFNDNITKNVRVRKLSISDRVRNSLSSLQQTNNKLLNALQKNLKIKRLVLKLLILTLTAILSTIIIGCSFSLWISIWAGISLDLIVNNTCMLLSFRCADNIFKRLYPCCSL